MSNQDQYEQKPKDGVEEFIKYAAIAVATIVGGVVGLFVFPIALPILIVRFVGPHLTPKAQFWTVSRWRWVVDVVGVVAIVALLLFELKHLLDFIRAGQLDAMLASPDPLPAIVSTFLPWGLLNLAAGTALLLPVAWTLYRRRIAWMVWKRRHPDVAETERITAARKRASDVMSARAIGVKLDRETGQIVRVSPKALAAPLPTKSGRQAFGVVHRSTVTTVPEMFRDARRVREWIDAGGRFAVVPDKAGSVRAVIVAESGTGKTFLINAIIGCILELGWPVVFVDAKGDPADAIALRDYAESYGYSVSIGGNMQNGVKWNFWTGTSEQITSKLMRLMPPPDGANQHYLDEIRGVLQAVQNHSPVRSLYDLRHRLSEPAAYVRDSYDLDMVQKEVTKNGMTAAERVLQAILVALRPIEPFLDDTGWSYGDRHADLTIVPVSPIEDAQAKLGELLLADLRAYIARRLTDGDKAPFVVVVDEFAQLVTDGADPGDDAASLFETMRSAGAGLIIAAQSVTGVSKDDAARRRVMTSGVAVFVGRTKEPEETSKLAGTVMQLETSGQPTGDGLGSGRAQHTYVLPPQDIREAADGSFWIIQAGAFAGFRGLPTRPRPIAAPVDEEQTAAEEEPAS